MTPRKKIAAIAGALVLGVAGLSSGLTLSLTGSSSSWTSFDAAYHAAAMNSIVDVPCGVYTGPQAFTFDASKTGGTVIFQPASPGCVTINGKLSLGANVSYITFRGFTINNADGVIGQPYTLGTLNRDIVLDSNLLNVGQKVNGRTIGLAGNIDGWQIIHNTIGYSCCGYGTTSGSSPEGIRIGKASSTAPNANNVTIADNLIQYVVRDCAYWPTSLAGACPDTTCPNTRGCHADGIHIWGMTNSRILRNRLYGVECQGIFLEPTNGSLNADIDIIGNAISSVVGGCSNKGIYVNANGTNTTAGTWNIAFNSGPSALIFPNACTGCAPGTVFNLTGNAMTLFVTNLSGNDAGCAAQSSNYTINYTYNVWRTGGTGKACGSTDTLSNTAFVNAVDPPAAGIDLHLVSGDVAVDFVPSSACALSPADIDGVLRPQGVACDAGAFELGGLPPPPPPTSTSTTTTTASTTTSTQTTTTAPSTTTQTTTTVPPPGLNVHECARTATILTVCWTPVSGQIGATFWVDGKRVSLTLDPTRTSVRFSLTAGAVYTVQAIGDLDAGSVTG
jgi:hypothetical protein